MAGEWACNPILSPVMAGLVPAIFATTVVA
jgi:hypothetical protein